jgi:hypothetical protein
MVNEEGMQFANQTTKRLLGRQHSQGGSTLSLDE